MSLIREYIRSQLPLLMEDKRGRVKAMGFPAEFAQVLHDFYPPWSHKYADWVASILAKDAWWSQNILNDPNNPPYKPHRDWEPGELSVVLEKAWEKQAYKEKFATIFQWMDSKNGGPKLNKMTFDEAYEKAWLLPELMKSEKKGEVVIAFPNKWRWVNLQVSYCEAEAVSMGHCADDSSGELHTLRDPKGYPHVTCTVNDEGVITQMKGRNNSVPKEEYHSYVVALLSSENITGIKTEQDEDFHWNDLSEEQKEKVQADNPNFEVTEQMNTVELLREGDVQKMKDQGVFDEGSVNLNHYTADFVIRRGLEDLFRDDDDWGSRKVVSFLVKGEPWNDYDYLQENFRDSWANYREGILGDISEENQSLLFAYFKLKNPNWPTEQYWSDDDIAAGAAWEGVDFDMVWEALEEDEEIKEIFADPWVEANQEAGTKAAIAAMLKVPVDQNIVDNLQEHGAGYLMTMSYDRLADLVDIHHPGTPMSGADVISMIYEIAQMYGDKGRLVSINPEDDIDGYVEDSDYEEANKTVARDLITMVKMLQKGQGQEKHRAARKIQRQERPGKPSK